MSMSNFNVSARKVRDVGLPLNYRRHAFGSCVRSYSALIGEKFSGIYSRFSTWFGFDLRNKPTAEQLSEAMNALEVERNKFLVKLRLFERQRLRDKFRGKRSPSKAALEKLYTPDWHVAVLPDS